MLVSLSRCDSEASWQVSESSARRLIAHVIPYRRRVKMVVSAPSSDVKLNRMSHSGSGDDEVMLSRTVDTELVVLVFTIKSLIGKPYVLCWVVVSVLFSSMLLKNVWWHAASGGGCGWKPAVCGQARDIYLPLREWPGLVAGIGRVPLVLTWEVRSAS